MSRLPPTLLFFFNDTATTEIYTLSLHDALPISFSRLLRLGKGHLVGRHEADVQPLTHVGQMRLRALDRSRSEEHTSELQSQSNLVCRLLLEKKKKIISHPYSGPMLPCSE